ncbi:MAG: hypothetical protein WBF06_01380 [Candidatus Acidiferrales bacterium]
MRKILLVAFISVLLGFPALAQQQQAQQQPQQQQQTAADPTGSDQQVFIPPPTMAQKGASAKPGPAQTGATPNGSGNGSTVGSNDRLFFALPNFGTVENAENIKPLTIKQKFDLQWRSTFDPVEFPYVGLLAGISQATNSDPGYGQGALGYAKRYGAAFLDSIDENFMVGAIYPSLLREDPRYYQMGKGGFFRRAGYSVSRIFVTRTDSGKAQFNFSEILGSATGAAIGTTYRVGNERSFGDAASDWGTQVGWDTVDNLMKEFWPDIRRQFHRNNS